MRIILDSNILRRDWWQKGLAFRIFRDGLERIGATWHIPYVVEEEVKKAYAREVNDKHYKARTALLKLEQLTNADRNALEPEPAKANSDYLTFWRQLTGRAIERTPLPDAPHVEVLSRVLEQRRPVNSKGDAYRDTLLWLTVLEVAANTDEPIAFITHDSDFGHGDQLHANLSEDIHRAGIDSNRFLFYPDLATFNTNVVEPSLRALKQIERAIHADDAVPMWIAKQLPEEVSWNHEDNVVDVHFDDAFDGIGRKMVSGVKVKSVELREARRLSSGDVLLAANVEFDANLSVDVSEEELRDSPEAREVLGDYTSLETEGSFLASVRVLYNPNRERATQLEVTGIVTA